MSTFNITVTPCMEFRHLPIICFFTFLFASSIILIAMASRPHQIVGAVVFVGVLLLLRILVRPTIHALRRHHWPYDVGADKKLQLRLAAVRESDPSLTGWPHIRGRMAAFSLWLVIGRPMYRDAQLKELGDAFLARYDFHGEIPALDDAISAYEQSLSLRGEGHKRHGVAVGDLGRALWRSCRDNREDGTRLSQCVGLLDEAAQLHPPGHPARDIWLSTLAMASELLFKEEGGMNTLEKAIRLSEESLQLRVSSHPTREPFPQSLLNECRRRVLLAYQELFWPEPLRLPRDALLISLGGALLTRFRERRGDRDVLDKVLRLHREALQLRPFSHPARWDGLRHLAAALQIQCKQYGDWPALEEAIVHYKEALRICPPDFVHRGVLLNSYGETLLAHSHRRGQMHTVTQAIGTLREALQLHPPGHFARSLSLYGLAEALRARCEREGNWDALEQVILLYREALQLPASRDRIRGSIDNGLGAALMNRFRQQGRLDTLADAIQLHHEALVLHPHGHCDRGVSLNHLAIALHARFQQQGGMDVLGEAVSSLRQALQQSPRGHVARAEWLNNLADALESWFEWHGGEDTLSEAINLHREALNLRARGDPGRGIALSHLGRALQIRHSKIGDQAALTEAIDLHRQSLELCPLDHPARDVRIDSLAGALQTLASRTGDTELLGQAISLYRETLRLRPTGHPLRARTLFHVGECLLTRRVDDADFVRGIGHISEALTHAATGVRERLLGAMSSLRVVEEEYDASRKKGDAASWIQHGPFILKLYRQAIQLLPLAANLGLSPTTRLEIAGGSDELSRRGAARAVLLNHVPEAVEMLEEGRGVFWSQALQLRSSALDNLPNEDRLELEGVFHDLEATSTNFPTGFNQERERLLERQRLLSVQAEELISRVRAHYPGFDRLLMPPAFGDLVSSLPDGYVVIVNTARRMHHALLLHRSSGLAAVVKVQAPRGGFDCDDIRVHMPRDFGSGADEAAQQTVSVIRGGNVRKAEFNSFEDVLVGLWVRVVQPVIKTLGLTRAIGRDRPRIWWCVTGELSFLPLHAAGRFKGAATESISDYAVSSYVPTLSTLTKARRNWIPILRAEVAGVLLCETAALGASRLPSVMEEVDLVRKCFETANAQVLNVSSPYTTRAEMRSVLSQRSAHILHLASHGTQARDPLNSAFLLHDGRFSIEEIMGLDLPYAVLAFLSACETAKGDRQAPDQAVHLAASMLFCGFRSVIGTMWLMRDEDGPKVARRVYERLFERNMLDLDDIPHALDDAVRMLRDSGALAEHWALFVHMGG